MRIIMKIADPDSIHAAWEAMARYVEEEEDYYDSPSAWYENSAGGYTTCTGKGEYILNGDILIFSGYRNSFGNAEYLSIWRNGQGEVRLAVQYNWNQTGWTEASTSLEIISVETSEPGKPFWLTRGCRQKCTSCAEDCPGAWWKPLGKE